MSATQTKRHSTGSPSTEQPPSQKMKLDANFNELDIKINTALRGRLGPEWQKDSVNTTGLLSLIANVAPDLIDEGYRDGFGASAFLSKHPDVNNLLKGAWESGCFSDVLNHPLLRIKKKKYIAQVHDEHEKEQRLATQRSWQGEFRGDVPSKLWQFIKDGYGVDSVYARYSVIVQSSGMGKSRLVDEFSKEHFVIPICLRKEASSGFPPADHAVRDFLTRHRDMKTGQELSPGDVLQKSLSFLFALFRKTREAVEDIYSRETIESHQALARSFRKCMTEGQTATECNTFRRTFYMNVLSVAAEAPNTKEMLCSPLRGRHHPVIKEFEELIKAMNKNLPVSTNKQHHVEPQVVLVLDEAHELGAAHGRSWTNFGEFRRTLRLLAHEPIFTLFLSTTGEFSQFGPAEHELSTRVCRGDLKLIKPFSDLGFDLLVTEKCVPGLTMEHITRESFMVQFGRPLFASRYSQPGCKNDIVRFAAHKLLQVGNIGELNNLSADQTFACLSQRLPLELVSKSYASLRQEMHQVEAHLRVCLRLNEDLTSMTTHTPSEPILSEAAFAIMQRDDFIGPVALQLVLREFSIKQGDRGELVVLLLLTLARDAVVCEQNDRIMWKTMECRYNVHWNRIVAVENFIRTLFKFNDLTAEPALVALSKAFRGSNLHFNHFIEVLEESVINRMRLAQLRMRGAAVLCANNQESVDVVIPVFCTGEPARAQVILIRVENDARYGPKPQQSLFDAMDPIALGLGRPTSVIRIVFALASKEESLVISAREMAWGDPGMPSKTKGGKKSKATCEVFDIWCAGVSSEFLGPVAASGANKDVWESLCDESESWRGLFKEGKDDIVERIRTYPGGGDDKDFWNFWCNKEWEKFWEKT